MSTTETNFDPASKTAGYIHSAMNRFCHGGAANSLFIADENPSEFFALLENAFEQHKPAFDQDAALVTDSVYSRWILNRRQRASAQYEAARFTLKPDASAFDPNTDVEQILIFDRYLTSADRALVRSLQKLNLIKKMARDDERWKFQLEKEKKKFEMEVQIFELRQKREEEEAAAQAERERILRDLMKSKPREDVVVGEDGMAYIPQEVDVEFDESGTSWSTADVYPSNGEVKDIIAKADTYPEAPVCVVRTYRYAGVVPAAYTPLSESDFQHRLGGDEFAAILSFEEWLETAAAEHESVPQKDDN